MTPRGGVNVLGVLLVFGLVAGAYWLYVYSPVYLDNLDVREGVAEAYNIRSSRDGDLRVAIQRHANDPGVGWHREDDGWGYVKIVGGLGITDDQITIERDEVNNRITIRVTYSREVQLKPTAQVRHVKFVVEKVGPLSR